MLNRALINSSLTQYMLSLGFLPKYSGFNYIKQCVEFVIMNNGVLSSLSTKVYPFIAKNSGTTAINIERNIRNSIKCAKEYCENNGMFDNLFFKVDHVSNKTLIGYLVDQLSNSAMEMNQVV